MVENSGGTGADGEGGLAQEVKDGEGGLAPLAMAGALLALKEVGGEGRGGQISETPGTTWRGARVGVAGSVVALRGIRPRSWQSALCMAAH